MKTLRFRRGDKKLKGYNFIYMILAIETATDVCSVAYQNDEGKTFEKRVETRGSHSEKLFLFIRDLMDKHRFSIDYSYTCKRCVALAAGDAKTTENHSEQCRQTVYECFVRDEYPKFL